MATTRQNYENGLISCSSTLPASPANRLKKGNDYIRRENKRVFYSADFERTSDRSTRDSHFFPLNAFSVGFTREKKRRSLLICTQLRRDVILFGGSHRRGSACLITPVTALPADRSCRLERVRLCFPRRSALFALGEREAKPCLLYAPQVCLRGAAAPSRLFVPGVAGVLERVSRLG